MDKTLKNTLKTATIFVATIAMPFMSSALGMEEESKIDINFKKVTPDMDKNIIQLDNKSYIPAIMIASKIGKEASVEVKLDSAESIFKTLTNTGITEAELKSITTNDKIVNQLSGNYLFHKKKIEQHMGQFFSSTSGHVNYFRDKLVNACMMYTVSVMAETAKVKGLEKMSDIEIEKIDTDIHNKVMKNMKPIIEDVNKAFKDFAKAIEKAGIAKDIEILRSIKIELQKYGVDTNSTAYLNNQTAINGFTNVKSKDIYGKDNKLALESLFKMAGLPMPVKLSTQKTSKEISNKEPAKIDNTLSL